MRICMNKDDHINQRIKHALKKLPATRKIILYVELRTRIVCYTLSRFLRDNLASSRARIHWIGGQDRPRRPERALIAFVVYGAMIVLCPRDYATWAAFWGGGAAIFLNLYTVYQLIPRRRAYWINSS